jgi:threonine/homoserine/homoserine lactone efflux protein
MDLELLLAMLAFTLPISILPGPNNLLSASHSSRYGFKETLPLISGMVFGWFLLGIVVGFGAQFIEENKDLLNLLTYIGVGYIIYLSYKIATARLVDGEEAADEKLGLTTGAILQVVNGKAFVHLLILMTVFGNVFGDGFWYLVVLLQVLIKLIGWVLWSSFGSRLKQTFSDERSGVLINRIMGISLFLVAIWIVIPK